MITLGVQLNHRTSVCLFDDDKLLYYNQEERISRKKDTDYFPVNLLKEVMNITSVVDVVTFSSYTFNKDVYEVAFAFIKQLGFSITSNKWISSCQSHHYYHAYKSFNSSGFDDALVIVRDGQGSEYTFDDGSKGYETSSVFHFTKEESNLLYKRLYRETSLLDEGGILPYEVEKGCHYVVTSRHDVGHFYDLITRHLGLGWVNACGKLMGLAPYGKPNDVICNLISDGKNFTNTLLKTSWELDVEKYPFLNPCNESNRETLKSLAFETQKETEKFCLDLVKKYSSVSNNIVMTGGVALNISANSYIVNNLPKSYSFYIDPMCGDEGNCIGAAQIINQHTNTSESIYIGGFYPDYQFSIEENESIVDASDSEVCDLISSGEIVAFFQGKSEAGPRALGNRSILFDPRIVNGNDIVNEVKCREKFRPFAATILLEDLEEWFDVKNVKESSHMMYTFVCKEGVEKIIPSVIHVDNTCRLQTMKRDDNPHYYDIIKCFKDKTGVPLLLNTSFNLAGDPLVETLEDALDTMRRSKINYMYLPEIGKVIHCTKYLQ